MKYQTNPIYWLLPFIVLSLFLTGIILFKKQLISVSDLPNINSYCFTKQPIIKKELPPKVISFLYEFDSLIVINEIQKIQAIKTPTYLVETKGGTQYVFDKNGDLLCQQLVK